VGQVLLGWREYGDRPTNIVYMGMGEPFDNYDEVLKSIRILNDGQGINIGARHITISTSGVIPGIERMATEGFQVELSVSLHAPDDALRDQLMPVNRKYPIAKLIEACSLYVAATKRIITFEYTLIRGVNDSRAQAVALAKLVKQLPSKVNLIPLSPVDGFQGQAPEEGTISMFVDVLAKAGLTSMVRASKGTRISAACGQLRRRVAGDRIQKAESGIQN
jgi:23S rRNA (adenine2503-C2)-methyltransferase